MDCEDPAIDLPANSPRELYIRAPNVCEGCYNTAGGWLKTGDMAFYVSQGKFYNSRPQALCLLPCEAERLTTPLPSLKELIKAKGSQVAPAELESVLLGVQRLHMLQ